MSQFPRAQEIDPSFRFEPNRVYSIPDLPGGLGNTSKLDRKVLAKAEQLSLHPRQEHMRMDIAKALTEHKPRSPKSKTGLFGILKRLEKKF